MTKEASMYEIVELEDGEFALSRVDGVGEPLVSIKFSQESIHYLKNVQADVVKVMIEAGLDVVSELTEEGVLTEEEPVLH